MAWFTCFLCCFSAAQTFSHVSDELLQGVDINTFGCFAGCGVSFFDFDENGWDDLTFVSIDQPIMIYANQGGQFSLFDTIPNTGEPKHPIWIDYDNDGDNDLFVSKYQGKPMLFRNDDMEFVDVAEEAGLPQHEGQENFGACWGDYDGDGFLDLYIANFNDYNDDYVTENVLLHNLGDGTFEDVTVFAGVGNGALKSNGCSWVDFNHDGLLDLHVINDRDYNKNALYLNSGDGTFEDVSEPTAADIGIFAMSSTFGDYDNDGWLDVYITNGPLVGNYLLKNLQGEVFVEQQVEQDVQCFAMCWSAQWIDYNNDMWLDLYVAVRDWGALPEPNYFFVNNEGIFADAPESIFPNDEYIGYANALGDFNNDGFHDLLQYSDGNEAPALWLNSGSDNNYLKLDLTGTVSNRNAIGTWIECYSGGIRQIRQTFAGEDYLAQDSQYEIFGLAQEELVDSLVISWPSGILETYYNIEANQTLELIEGALPPEIQTEQQYVCVGSSLELSSSGFEEYLWSTGDTTSVIEITEGGWYWVEATTENGSSVVSDSTFIDLFFPPPYSLSTSDVSCFGQNDGSVEFSNFPVDGIQFNWENGDSDSVILNMEPGIYSVSVANEYCQNDLEITISQPDSLELNFTIVEPSCFGEADGMAELDVTGGTEPYFPNWTVDPEALSAGEYSLELTDANGCVVESAFSVSQPDELLGNLVYTSLSQGQFEVEAIITGGHEPYIIEWSDGQFGTTITTLADQISVIVTDANGCELDLELSMVAVAEFNLDNIVISPNPASDEVSISGLPLNSQAQVIVFDGNGRQVLIRDNYRGGLISLTTLADGVYTLEIRGIDFAYQSQIIVSR